MQIGIDNAAIPSTASRQNYMDTSRRAITKACNGKLVRTIYYIREI